MSIARLSAIENGDPVVTGRRRISNVWTAGDGVGQGVLCID
jgi:hypothetical protein